MHPFLISTVMPHTNHFTWCSPLLQGNLVLGWAMCVKWRGSWVLVSQSKSSALQMTCSG